MDIDLITQYIMTIAPALVSILTVISTMVVSIKKIKNGTNNAVNMVKEQTKVNTELKQQLNALTKENAELKKEMRSCINRINKVSEAKNGKK